MLQRILRAGRRPAEGAHLATAPGRLPPEYGGIQPELRTRPAAGATGDVIGIDRLLQQHAQRKDLDQGHVIGVQAVAGSCAALLLQQLPDLPVEAEHSLSPRGRERV